MTIVAQWQTPVEWERLLQTGTPLSGNVCCNRTTGTDALLAFTCFDGHHCILSPVVFSCSVPERRVCSTRRVRGWLHVAATVLVAACRCWCDGVGGWRYKTARAAWLETPVATSLIQCPLAVSQQGCFPGAQILRLRRRLSRNFSVAIGAFRSPSGTLREQAKIGLWRGQNLKFPVIQLRYGRCAPVQRPERFPFPLRGRLPRHE